MNAWPLSIKIMQDGKVLLILFDDNSEFSISAELLRVEGPSADIQGLIRTSFLFFTIIFGPP